MPSQTNWETGPIGSHWFMMFGQPLQRILDPEIEDKKFDIIKKRKKEIESFALLFLLNRKDCNE